MADRPVPRKRNGDAWSSGRTRSGGRGLGRDPILGLAELAINNDCNLTCLHCSYVMPMSPRPHLGLCEWVDVVSQLLDLGVEHLHICGKEPLLSPWFQDLLSAIGALIQGKSTKYGFVTNGTILEKSLGWLRELPIDYVDISVDGLEAGHDLLRGRGMFALVCRQVDGAIQALGPERVCLATVAYSRNIDEIPAMISGFRDMGVRYFFLQPVQMPGRARTRMELVISPQQLQQLLQGLTTRTGDGQALIELYVDYQYKEHLLSTSELFRRSCEAARLGKTLAFEIPLGKLQLSFNRVCHAFRDSCVITPAGEYLGCCRQVADGRIMGPRIGHVTDERLRALVRRGASRSTLSHLRAKMAHPVRRLGGAGIVRCPFG